jgi:hypothetical protein
MVGWYPRKRMIVGHEPELQEQPLASSSFLRVRLSPADPGSDTE